MLSQHAAIAGEHQRYVFAVDREAVSSLLYPHHRKPTATRFADFADREGGSGVGIGGGGTALLAARAQVLEGDFGRVEGAGLGGGEHRDSQRTDQALQCRSSKTHRLQLRLIAARSHYEGRVAHAGRAPKYVRYVPLLRAAASSTPRS